MHHSVDLLIPFILLRGKEVNISFLWLCLVVCLRVEVHTKRCAVRAGEVESKGPCTVVPNCHGRVMVGAERLERGQGPNGTVHPRFFRMKSFVIIAI